MTFFEFIKRCLHMEAIRTEPDPRPLIEKIMKESEKDGTDGTVTAD